jgi:predicted alpha/beta hydrolase family esterase
MRAWYRFAAIGVLAIGMVVALGSSPGAAQSRAHVYLFRGLMNIFSLGMDTLSEELNKRGVYATVYNHTEWQGLAERAAANYRAGKEGPIIIIGHSLGADAAMEMAAYLDRKGIPVALVVPFDGTQSFSAPSNVARVVNLTQRDYAFMRAGPGFHGSLINVDVRNDPNIDHLNIDKSPRLHSRVIGEVLAITGGGHRIAAPGGSKPASAGAPAAGGEEGGAKAQPGGGEAVKPEATPAAPAAPAAPPKSGDGAMHSTQVIKPIADSGTPVIVLPERSGAASDVPIKPSARKPAPAQARSADQLPN